MEKQRRLLVLVLAAVLVVGTAGTARAYAILGTGTGALVGNDLTDLANNGVKGSYAPPNLAGFDAVFFANDKPNFGSPEAAFNMFDNTVGGGDAKWCCGNAGLMPPVGLGMIVGANFATTLAAGPTGIKLTGFTVTSGNDSSNRDPAIWRIEGSNDTTNGLDGTWTTIYDHATALDDWTARDQVIRYSPADGDLFLTSQAFDAFRMVTAQTAQGNTGGAFFQLGEVELFGQAVPEPATLSLLALGGLALLRRRRR